MKQNPIWIIGIIALSLIILSNSSNLNLQSILGTDKITTPEITVGDPSGTSIGHERNPMMGSLFQATILPSGAVCAESISYMSPAFKGITSGTSTSTTVCVENHAGAVYSIVQLSPNSPDGGWASVLRQVNRDSSGCWLESGLTPNQYYKIAFWYCDITADPCKTCTQWTPVKCGGLCGSTTKTYATRTCPTTCKTIPPSDSYTSFLSTTEVCYNYVVDKTKPGCTTTTTPTTTTTTTPTTQPVVTPVVTTVTSSDSNCVLTGDNFEISAFDFLVNGKQSSKSDPVKVLKDSTVSVTGTVSNIGTTDGVMNVECGIYPADTSWLKDTNFLFSTLPIEPVNNCQRETSVQAKKITLQKGGKVGVNWEFKVPSNADASKDYVVYCGTYENCYSETCDTLSSDYKKVLIDVVESTPQVTSVAQILSKTDTSLTVSGTLRNPTSKPITGIVSLEMNKVGVLSQSIFTPESKPCYPGKTDDVHGTFTLDANGQTQFTLTSNPTSSGVYSATVRAFDRCCFDADGNAQTCNEITSLFSQGGLNLGNELSFDLGKCTDECTAGTSRCLTPGGNAVQQDCIKTDTILSFGGCNVWGPEQTCENGCDTTTNKCKIIAPTGCTLQLNDKCELTDVLGSDDSQASSECCTGWCNDGALGNTCQDPPTPITPPDNKTITKATSYLYDDWLDTTAKSRMENVCNDVSQCAKYITPEGETTDYKVRCSASAQIRSQLEDDVEAICAKEAPLIKYFNIMGISFSTVTCKALISQDPNVGACIASSPGFFDSIANALGVEPVTVMWVGGGILFVLLLIFLIPNKGGRF